MIAKLLEMLRLKARTTPPPYLSELEEFEYKKELFRRIRLAERTQQGRRGRLELLYDPIEDEPATADLVRRAAAKADAEIDKSLGMGRCFQVWARTKEILRKKHGITWYSTGDMNPDMRFD